jgi:hypothetical protein
MTKRYLWVRNMLIVEMLHERSSVHSVVLPLLSEALAERRGRRYAHLTALVRGMEDFLKDPEWLEGVDNDLLIASLKKEQNHLLRPLHNLPKFVPGYFIAKARWMSFLHGANFSV